MTRPVQNAQCYSSVIHAKCGFQPVRKCGTRFSRVPSPSGRGCREAAGEGENRPHPALRATFSRKEKGRASRVSDDLGHLCSQNAVTVSGNDIVLVPLLKPGSGPPKDAHPAPVFRLRPVGLALRGATFFRREKDLPMVSAKLPTFNCRTLGLTAHEFSPPDSRLV
jgi:hypothetical protein